MTDDNDQVRIPPPPRRKASPKRTPPPPRRAKTVAGGANGDDPIAALVKQNQELMAQLSVLASGGIRYVETEPESKVIARVADEEELTDFQRETRASTQPTPQGYVRKGTNYNYPELLYAKPDGSIVSLQGDPGNRAYYKDKGFTELSPEQTRRWRGGEHQKLVIVQREKANLINTLRELVARDPSLKASISTETEKAWDHMSVAELEAFLDELMGIPDQNGKPRRKLRPPQRLIDAENRKAQAEMDRLMVGVETSDTMSMEKLEAKLKDPRSQGPR